MKDGRSVSLEDLCGLAKALPADDRPQWLIAACQEWVQGVHRYYRFLYELGKMMPGARMIEIGTFHGGSAAQFAYGSLGLVVTVDVDPRGHDYVRQFPIGNIVPITADSLEHATCIRRIVEYGDFNVCFIDGQHNQRAHEEFLVYREFVGDGGIILFDDIDLNDEMRGVWARIPEPKASLPGLHHSGFGAHIKTRSL